MVGIMTGVELLAVTSHWTKFNTSIVYFQHISDKTWVIQLAMVN